MSGLIAQDVEKAAEEAGYDFSGVQVPDNPEDLYSLRYSDFVIPLVKAVQELADRVGGQQAMIEQQNIKIEMLMNELALIKEKQR